MTYQIVLACFFSLIFALSIEARFPGLYVFGDSVVDVGNNDFIQTPFKSDFFPYGISFFGLPTGRFSDGKLVVDYVSSCLKLPLIPPFLQPGANFAFGANFASAGAGALPTTNQGLALSLDQQINYFSIITTNSPNHPLSPNNITNVDYPNPKGQIYDSSINSSSSATISTLPLNVPDSFAGIKSSVYLIVFGSNDITNYLMKPELRKQYTFKQYARLIITSILTSVKVLYNNGASKFVLVGVPPLGCLPSIIASTNSNGCNREVNSLVSYYNSEFNSSISKLRRRLPGAKLLAAFDGGFIKNASTDPESYGFLVGVGACCGAGPYRALLQCGRSVVVNGMGYVYELCPVPMKYVWWDFQHSTEQVNEVIGKAWCTSNDPKFISPINISKLFIGRK